MITISAIALAVTLTSYQPIPAQTKPDCKGPHACSTSINDGITRFGCAVSQDLLKSGRVKYGDVLYIPGIGYRTVNDCMNVRHANSVDILVLTLDEEKRIGVRHLTIYKLEKPNGR